MVNLKKIADMAKDQIDKRGGTDALKEDLSEVGDAVKGKGSVTDKAKKAAAAVKEPGKNEEKA